MEKESPRPFLTINDACERVGEPAHVLRFWESKFSQIRPVKRSGGRRYYREKDIRLLRGIRVLVRDSGYAIRGVQRMLRERGAEVVMRIGEGDPAADPVQCPAAPAAPAAPADRGWKTAELQARLGEALALLSKTANELRQ